MKCPLCEREIQPEITELLEIGCIIRKWQCPKCFWFFKYETIPFKPREFRHIKEIIQAKFEF